MTDVYISVDWETDGRNPGINSGVAVGACVVTETMIEQGLRPVREDSFKAFLKPITDTWSQKALDSCHLDRNWLRTNGEAPEVVMPRFLAWVKEQRHFGRPVFVGFNAPFDWSFNHYYMDRFSGEEDIFGISGIDIKAYLMSILGLRTWSETRKNRLIKLFLSDRPHTHDPLDDALEQGEIWIKAKKFATQNKAVRSVVSEEIERITQQGGFHLQ